MKSTPLEVTATLSRPLGMPPARFLRDYWQKSPLLIRGAFVDFKPPLTPDDLAGLACMEEALSRIVIHDPKRDRWTLRSGPFVESDFAQLPETGWTLLVQDVDKWDADIAALLDAFNFLPSWRIDDVMVSYATDGGGVGAHLDHYDVFLLQNIGQRRWRIDARAFIEKTAQGRRGSCEGFAYRDDTELKLLREFIPTHEWTLDTGDVLYLPPGVPHEGIAIGECMTYSIGMRAPSAAELLIDFAEFMAERLPEDQRYADPDLDPARDPGEIDDAAIARVMRTLPWLRVELAKRKSACVWSNSGFACGIDASLLSTWFGGFITRYRSGHEPVPRKRAIDPAALDAKLQQSIFKRDPRSRFAFRREKRGATLYVAGQAHPCPLSWARALTGRGHRLDGARLAKLARRKAGVALLAALINAGDLTVRRR